MFWYKWGDKNVSKICKVTIIKIVFFVFWTFLELVQKEDNCHNIFNQ